MNRDIIQGRRKQFAGEAGAPWNALNDGGLDSVDRSL
jgi:hypothetical protein